METTLAILMVLGIFVGIPAIIGFAIVGVHALAIQQARKAERQVRIAPEAQLQKV